MKMENRKVRIVIDSTADTTAEVREKCTIVPLTVSFGDRQYLDCVDIDHRRFYEMLIESDTLPTTSQPSPAAFAAAYEEAVKAGEQVVVITISANLSGTFQSANIAAMEYSDDVIVVDSKNVSIATGILAEYAVSLAEKGVSARELASALERERERLRVLALFDTLEYLKMGGRISKTAAFAGGMLNIKPVAGIQDGKINILGKARGSKQGNNFLVREMQQSGGVDFDMPLMLGYTGLDDAMLQKYIQDSDFLWREHTDTLRCTPIGSVIGTHAGPGAIGVAYFEK